MPRSRRFAIPSTRLGSFFFRAAFSRRAGCHRDCRGRLPRRRVAPGSAREPRRSDAGAPQRVALEDRSPSRGIPHPLSRNPQPVVSTESASPPSRESAEAALARRSDPCRLIGFADSLDSVDCRIRDSAVRDQGSGDSDMRRSPEVPLCRFTPRPPLLPAPASARTTGPPRTGCARGSAATGSLPWPGRRRQTAPRGASSRNAVSSQRRPSAPTNGQRPSSRFQTSRRTAARMRRPPPGEGDAVRGRLAAARRVRSNTTAMSPSGTA
jgi:hypothetical protein